MRAAKSSGRKPRKQAAARRQQVKTAQALRGIRRQNGAAADAKELFQVFHGRESTSHQDYEIPQAAPSDLADLGRLIELSVYVDEDDLRDLRPRSDVRVACVPRRIGGKLIGTQIYFIGGDQVVNLADLGIDDDGAPKDHVMIGPVQFIAYHTSKDFHDFAPSDYEHQFGEESGQLPYLGYDTRNQLIYLIGGAYRVERPGIID